MSSIFSVEFLKNEIDELMCKMCSRVAALYEHEYLNDAFMLKLGLGACESPIEQLFYLAFREHEYQCRVMSDNNSFSICPQFAISYEGKRYRADFLLYVLYNGNQVKLIVECDGHDFHEKTKTQAKHDKQRDRVLIGLGYKIIRFTGSEIWNGAEKCVQETINIMFGFENWNKFMESFLQKNREKHVVLPGSEIFLQV